MKKLVLPVIGFIVLLAVFFGMMYNGLVSSQTNVEQASAKIETALQRRYELIPNVVNATKGYMDHETEVFKAISDARSKIGSSSGSDKIKAEGELDSAVSRLLVVVENYPQLKSDTHVSALITELEGSENRIFVARNDYNEAATKYNKKIRRFPSNLFASMFGFEKVELYKSDKNAQKAPVVDLKN